ncbi:DUF4214 domain-containing protein [Massilia violaceinigra]|uniref:DUF4214 domain-containing protein n=1 Tax=Massilia violaceinigra TaxID=2045208 RepID=A0ABY4A333_9BURK|nr:DUF4214 domain-containing protein [Massilia violaceinigra]UOD29164.1 DUF4214 domain-containing protein [Massilia violaceinigra]
MAAASAYTRVAQELYVSYFGRPADPTGFMAMTAALSAAAAPFDTAGLDAAYASNAAVRSLIDSFNSSAESRVLYGTPATGFDTVRFVSQIYNNLFGRTPDAGGLAFWTRAIDSGALTQAAAAHSILTGAMTASNADAELITKKITLANMFTAAMDTPVEFDAYRGDMAAQFGRDLLARVTASSDPSAFQATVDATLAQLSTATKLTVGTDIAAGQLLLADLDGNSNTLQTSDSLSGGDHVDTLRAVLLPTSNNQVPAPASVSIEHVRVHAADPTDGSALVALDGGRMNGVRRWENDHSRGDLTIRNVNIQNKLLPEEVTIAMVGSAAGDADFSVYFNADALRAGIPTAGSATLRLQVMDTSASAAGAAPLAENPYDGFRFLLNKVPVQVRSAAIDQAQTYEALLSAIRAEIAATPALEKLVASLGEPFQVYDTSTGKAVNGREIVISNSGPGSLGIAPGAGWLQPGAGEEGTRVSGPSSGAVPLITATIELDNVGRGGIGGDLIVGGTPYLSTRVSAGFEAFNISVERTSLLQTIDSSDSLLQSVTLANGAIKGDLAVRGAPGGSLLSDAYGFHDVRQIDASAMSGKVDLTAVITPYSATKYLAKPGTQTGSAGEPIDFHYAGGGNNDTLTLDIWHGATSSRGIRLAGQADFRFDISGGDGDDILQVRVLAAPSGDTAWLIDQDRNHNLKLSGGDGNDTIRKPGAGDAVIDGGAGDDKIDLIEAAAGLLQVASDNLIDGGIGNDTIALGLVEAATAAQSSNDTLILGRAFGNDKIFNFDVSGPGIDHLDLSALGGLVLTNALNIDKSITIAAASAANDTPARIAGLFGADNAAVQTHVYGVLDAAGRTLAIYAIADAAGAGNAVATAEGTIDFSAADVGRGLTAANFVNAASAAYNQAEGASSAVAPTLVGVAPEADVSGMMQA